jgi:undecaprenyl diphosphate synthase
VGDLMTLLRHYLRGEVADLHRNNVRVRVIGDRERLAPDIVTLIDNTEALTAQNTRLQLSIALSYGGRAEITGAARRIAAKVRAGTLDPAQIDEACFASHLLTVGMPDPDLVIRTSGEQRLSNFLLWQTAYAEFIFIETLWPDFTKADFERALDEYRGRERRYGASVGQR